MLLVQLADVEARHGLTTEAERSAQDALEYLDQFGRPSSIPDAKWPEIQKELKASCFFVLGRVNTSVALGLPAGGERTKRLANALKMLGEAQRLNADDPEIVYLTGLDYLALGNPKEAAKCIATTCRTEGPLKPITLAKLKKIFNQSQHAAQSVDQYLAGLGRPDPAPPPAAHRGGSSTRAKLPDYTGSSACGACHPDIYRNWSHTGMSRMLSPYKAENILGDFTTDNVFYLGDEIATGPDGYQFVRGKNPEPFARMIIDRGKHYFEINQADHLQHRYAVDYTIGSKWRQGYVTRLPNEELQVLPIEYNLAPGNGSTSGS